MSIKFNILPINKPIKLKGLSPFQFFGAIIGSGLSFMIPLMFGLNFLISIICVICIILPTSYYGSKINKEYKNGNPDPVNSLKRYNSIYKNYTDSFSLLNLISSNKK